MRSLGLLLASALTLAALVGPGCDKQTTRQEGQPVRVAASLPPLADLVKRIGRDHVEVKTLIGPGKTRTTTTRPCAIMSGWKMPRCSC